MVDPFSYRSRLTQPKLLIHGTNDPYWTVDASQKYWDDLEGPKYMLTLPNVGHNLGNEKLRAYLTLSAFVKKAFRGGNWPKIDWKSATDASGKETLTTTCEIPARKAKLWTATSSSKDFRKATWTSTDLPAGGDGRSFEASVPKPDEGHVAYYMELEFEADGQVFPLTTQVFRR